MKIDNLIEQAKKQGIPEVAIVLAFTKSHGTDATIGLLYACQQHANAGIFRRLWMKGLLNRALARIKGPLSWWT